MPSLQIAHLSDPHLPLASLRSLREIRFKRLLSLLSWQLKRRHVHLAASLVTVMNDIRQHSPDLVALTGDLTNLGLQSEYEAATRWLEDQALPPTLLVPGNHDALIREHFNTKSSLWTQWLRNEHGFPSVLQKEKVALIGLNSAVPTPLFFASGRLSGKQLEVLSAILRQSREEGLCRVVLIHHPPAPGLVTKRKALEHMDTLQTVLRREGAELVLHGHSHRATLSCIPGTTIPVVGTTSASHRAADSDRTAGWNRVTITPDTDCWRISIQRRELGEDGIMQNGFVHHFTPHRLSDAKAL